jgi:hypothetical protein
LKKHTTDFFQSKPIVPTLQQLADFLSAHSKHGISHHYTTTFTGAVTLPPSRGTKGKTLFTPQHYFYCLINLKRKIETSKTRAGVKL